jgi:LL-H family phage holin
MNWAQFINTLIFVFGTFLSILEAIWLSRVWAQKLPDHIRPALVQCAEIAVRQVEQQSGSLGGPAKRELAITIVTRLFHAYRLPLPDMSAVDSAIEAAVFSLPKKGGV